jgi:DNA-binding beta-propeller fold protein YncE
MANMTRGTAAVIALALTAVALAACGQDGRQASFPDSQTAEAERIVPAPKSLISAAEPRANGTIWALAGQPSIGLFKLDSVSGQITDSVSVTDSARSVAESAAGVLGLALGTGKSGALQLLDGRTAKIIQTIALPAPARQVVAGSDGTTFYVLTAWANSASVTIVNSQNGKIKGNIPVPLDTTSVAGDIQQTALYVLQDNGLVDEIGIPGGKIAAVFKVGDKGESIALSPDGSTLYVLKGTSKVSNIAVVNVSTESVRRVLPTPSDCRQLLVSATGNQLYEVVGTSGYGNIQVFAV